MPKALNLCYNVFMSNTTEHISLRIPAEVAAELRREAKALDRSLAWVVVNRLRGSGEHFAGEYGERLPQMPGVYVVYGENDVVLYVGQTKNFKQRHMSHGRIDEFLEQARRLECFREDGLEARKSLEKRLIDELKPLLNGHQDWSKIRPGCREHTNPRTGEVFPGRDPLPGYASIKGDRRKKKAEGTDGAPRFAPPGDRPVVGAAPGLAGAPENSAPFRPRPSVLDCGPDVAKSMGIEAEGLIARRMGSGGGMEDAAAASKRQGIVTADTRPSAAAPDEAPAGSSPAPSPSERRKILDDLAWGEMQDGLYNNGADAAVPEPEVEICGHREHIWETGEWVMCTLPKNHRKGRHGNPVKVEGPE